MNTSSILKELNKYICSIESPDPDAIEASKKHWLNIVKPLFSLGKFEPMVTKIAGIKGCCHFRLDRKALVIMCADNGVVEEGVTQTGQEVTAAVTKSFSEGKTSVCLMAKRAGCKIYPVDIGVSADVPSVTIPEYKVAYGTKNITLEPAMTMDETVKAILTGIRIVEKLKNEGMDIIATGEMGIGNTTTSSAIAAVLLNTEAEAVTGRGAGLSSEGLAKKIAAIKKAIAINEPDKNNPLDVLSKVGGLDIAGLTGVFLGGAIFKIPIVIDGFISSVSALLAARLNPKTPEYMIASHISKEPAGKMLLNELKLSPVICADMCLGEGTGAVALFPLLDMAHDIYEEMTVFDEWTGGDRYTVQK